MTRVFQIAITLSSLSLAIADRDCYGCIGWCTYGDRCVAPSNATWVDALTLGLGGQGWATSAMKHPYARFPAHAEALVDKSVWGTAQESAGVKVRFSTTATDLWINWAIEPSDGDGDYKNNGDWLWPVTGHIGVDLYIEDEGLAQKPSGDFPITLRWAMSSGNGPKMHTELANMSTQGLFTGVYNIPPRADGHARNYTLYMPLSSAPSRVQIAALTAHGGANVPIHSLAKTATAVTSSCRVLFYGTSIMNGAAANRPGMGWPQQAERMLSCEGINIGFGGLGQMQPYYASSGLLSEIDYTIAIVDPHYNVDHLIPSVVYNRTVVFISELLRRKPDSPVLLVEGHPSPTDPEKWNLTASAFRLAFNTLLSRGVKNLHYGPGECKFGGRDFATDFQAQASTVNGVHPPPLALRSMATYVSGIARGILNGTAPPPQPFPQSRRWELLHDLRSLDAAHTKASRRAAAFAALSSSFIEAYSSSASSATHKSLLKHPQHRGDLQKRKFQSPRLPPMRWIDASTSPSEIAVDGKGFTYDAHSDVSFWQRFPSNASGHVPANIFRLAMATSGIMLRFRTNAPMIVVRVIRNVPAAKLAEEDDIFTFNGRDGIDCHIQDGSAVNYGQWRWHATEAGTSTKQNGTMTIDLSNPLTAVPPRDGSGLHNLTVYLPTWDPVSTVLVGVPLSSSSFSFMMEQPLSALLPPFAPPPVIHALQLYARDVKPLYVWGSSIAQGGAVTNAGMTWPMNLQRLANQPLLNFGFSGSCGMQLDVAAQLAKARPSPRVFLMDCQPNMQQDLPPTMRNKTRDVLQTLRAVLPPSTPIVVMEGHLYTNNWIKAAQSVQQLALAAAQKIEVLKAQRAGDTNLYYLGAEGKLGADVGVAQESTGGIGVHPTSLAHLHMAEYVYDALTTLNLI